LSEQYVFLNFWSMAGRVLAFSALLLSTPLIGAEKLFDFAESKPNETPAGFRSTLSGEGKPGDWKIITDEMPQALPPVFAKIASVNRRPVLAQLARDKTDEHSPLLIYDGEEFRDFKVSTRFKLVDGEVEQMAGIAFRIQDEKNYYYVRASGLGNSFYFFKIVNGLRSQPIGPKIEISRGVWHELAVECKGSEIHASLDGNEVLPTLGDKSFSSGKIGFWTKSDSVSYFADMRITYTPTEKLAQALVRDMINKYPRLKGIRVFARANGDTQPMVIGSNDPAQLGQPATPEVLDVISNGQIYHSKKSGEVTITMPLRDNNGDRIAAVKVIMKAFPGQTEKNALARALPIVKQMEGRVQNAKELLQ